MKKIPCVHIENGTYVVSCNGLEIDGVLSVTLEAGDEDFHIMTLKVLVTPMSDNSHIKPVNES